jgi:exonuclease III
MNRQPKSTIPIRIASINVNGLKKNFTPIVDLVQDTNLDFIACQETWSKPGEYINRRQNLIALETLLPNPNNHNLHQGGICIIRHPTRTTETDFKLIQACAKGTCIWFMFRNKIMIGTFYLAPQLTDQERNDALNSIQQHHNPNIPMVILGDFNTRLGGLTGDSKTTKRAHLQPFATNLDAADLHIILPPIKPTWTFISSIGRSVIDYIALSTNISHHCSDLHMINDGRIDSPHKPIWIELDIETEQQLTPPKPPKWRLQRLNEEKYLKEYTKAIEDKKDSSRCSVKAVAQQYLPIWHQAHERTKSQQHHQPRMEHH